MLQEQRYQELITNLQILLREKCRDPHVYLILIIYNSKNFKASWSKTRQLLEADPRYTDIPLPSEMKQNIFREHCKNLTDVIYLYKKLKNYLTKGT